METISERSIGGRHRQGGEAAEFDRIPAPRRDGPRTDQIPSVSGPRRTRPTSRRDSSAAAASFDLDELPEDDAPEQRPLREPTRAGFGRGDVADERDRASDNRASDAAWDGETWDDETWDGETWDDETWDGETWDDETMDGETMDGPRDGKTRDGETRDETVDNEAWDEHAAADRDRAGERRPTGDGERAVERRPGIPAYPTYQQPDTRRRRRRAVPVGGRVLRRTAWMAVGIAALVGVVLAAIVIFPELTDDPATEVPLAVAAPVAAESVFGERVARADGWTIEIDEPRAVRAGDDIDLPSTADRGLVFEVVLTNTSDEPRNSAAWMVKAIVGSSPVDVLPDGSAPSRTIRPGASLTFPVTVPMPEATTDVQLEAAPIGSTPSLFLGTV